LILFTNDGDLSQRLSHPRYQIPKTYHVEVDGDLKAADIKRLERGIRDKGDLLQARSADIIQSDANGGILKIVVTEGRKREIRRMCKHLNFKVNRLIRVAIGSMELGEFKAGFSRELTPEEVELLASSAN
jgi:23S rRNA pseudouridine2605 synthase